MTKMSDDDLLAHIATLEKQALGYFSSEVAASQAKAMDYYMSKPFGNEEEGRSQVISSDVWDVVEGMTPLIIKPFIAASDVVRFSPLGPDDEEAALQESEYINWVITQRNDSFNEFLAWCKTGLLQKNGVVKYWWDKSQRTTVERYEGLSEDLLAIIAGEPNIEIMASSPSSASGIDGAALYDVQIRVTEDVGQAKYQAIPPEEIRVSRDATSPDPKKATFFQHARMATIGYLRGIGYDVPTDVADDPEGDPSNSSQFMARRSAEEDGSTDHGNDPLNREVLFKETYLVIDRDGDGQQELRKVCQVGRLILEDEETEEIPFSGWTPYQQPFKFYGRCPADETIEIQAVKSALIRQTLDNIYTINNNRVYAKEGVNVDDLTKNHIGGVVRVEGDLPISQMVMPASVTPIGGVTMPMLELMDSAKENRTGFTRYNQGSDSGSLNKTAHGIQMITEAANQRIDIIQRAFANAVADLTRGIHGLCRRHATQRETFQLRGKWVDINPRAWKLRRDLSVSVGIGALDTTSKLQGLQMMMAEQKALAQVGIVQPQNFLAGANKMAETLGFKNPGEFFSLKEEGPGIPPEVQAVLQQAQSEIQALRAELEKAQSGIAAKQIEAQAKAQMADASNQFAVLIQRMKDESERMKESAAYDRQELAGVVALLSKQISPPQQLVSEVSEDMQDGPD